MKTLIWTIAVGDFYKNMGEKVSHPMMAHYAEKIGADFNVVYKSDLKFPHYEKFQMWSLLKSYDRIIYLDTDIILHPDTPNLFEIVPSDRLGMLDESPLGYDKKFETFLSTYNYHLLPLWWKTRKCYNAGVIICSKKHQDIFNHIEIHDHYKEQSFLNTRIIETKTKMWDLPSTFNRMIYLDLILSEHRLKSYIVHYAGFLENRPIEECIKFMKHEYQMMLSQDFSEDKVKLQWRNI